MFSENDKDFLESLPLNMRIQTLMQVQKERKKKKKKKRKKQRLEKQIKVKRKEKKIYNLYNNLPPRQRRQKFDTIKELMSSPKGRSVEVINNPVRPGSNHMEVNYINYK
jgi:hypothetical protein